MFFFYCDMPTHEKKNNFSLCVDIFRCVDFKLPHQQVDVTLSLSLETTSLSSTGLVCPNK